MSDHEFGFGSYSTDFSIPSDTESWTTRSDSSSESEVFVDAAVRQLQKTGRIDEADVVSLAELTQQYILMHLEEFPISFLSLLPCLERKSLLYRLPIADVCLLEDTEFTNGLDMEAYWKQLTSYTEQGGASNIFIKKWGPTKFAKAVVYDKIARNVLRFSIGDLRLYHPSSGSCDSEAIDTSSKVFKFLYAVKTFPDIVNEGNGRRRWSACYGECTFTIPTRYEEKAKSFSKANVIDAVVSCFGGERPKILTSVIVTPKSNMYNIDFLSNLHYLAVDCVDYKHYPLLSLQFVLKVVKVAQNLEVLTIVSNDDVFDECDSESESEMCRISLNRFCRELSSLPTFWNKFRLLKLVCWPGGFAVSQKEFNKLISTYLSTPTQYPQTVSFTKTKIVDYGDQEPPKFDERYLKLKKIELMQCRFVSKRHANMKEISRWMGRKIEVLKSNEDGGTWCLFKVSNSDREGTTCTTRKRRKTTNIG